MTLESLTATAPELAVLNELVRLGKTPGFDFTFQASILGGRLEKGGLIVDFLFNDPPGLAISVAGEYWHFERGFEVRAQDLIARQVLAGLGITLIFIEESHALEDVRYYVGEALRFRDHSRLSR